MASRSLRSRVAGLNTENQDSPAGESTSGLGSREASEGLGSLGETEQLFVSPVSENDPNPLELDGQTAVQQSSVSETNDVTQMLSGIMAAIQQMEGSVKADIAATKESVRADLLANNEILKESVRAELAASQESFKIEISKFRTEMQAENEALANKFENQNKQTRKEFSGKLDAESRRLTNLVNQVKGETESELLGFKRQLQTVSSAFEEKLEQTSNNTQSLIEELANHVDERQSDMNNKIQELGQEMNSKFERQKERNNQTALEQKLDQVNAKIVALEDRVSASRTAVVNETQLNEPNLISPSAVQSCDLQRTHVQISENRSCSCQSSTCNECMNNNVSACRMNVEHQQQMSSFLSSSELPLPQFDEAKDNNPVYHSRQLDEFMRVRGVPKALQLAVAYRSMTGQMAKQWAETASWNLKDYQEFRREFLSVWWSSSRQSLVKCRLYQGKFNRSSGISISAYFLQQATTASYLEPRLSDIEIIEAIRFHYPIQIQRAMLSNQLTSIGDALDLLKRVEVMEASEGYQRPHNPAPQNNPIANRQNQMGPNDRRAQPQGHVRQIQVRSPRRNNNRNWRRWNRNQEERPSHLNPNAPSFPSNQQPETASVN